MATVRASVARRVHPGSISRRGSGLLAVAMLASGLLAGCARPFAAPAPTATPVLTEQQIVQKAMVALSKVQTVHFKLTTDTGGKPVGGSFSLLAANGDAARPDRLAASVQASIAGFSTTVRYVSVGSKHYMSDPISHQWTTAPAQLNTMALLSPQQGAPAIVKSMGHLTKAGIDQIGGAGSYHLTGTVAGSVLQPLLGVTVPGQLQANVWIGAGDFLIRKMVLTGPIFKGDPPGTARTLELSKFNSPVSISLPTLGSFASS